MNRIVVESKSAAWQRCDLRTTRLKDPDRGQLLIFKELEWQTVRIEAQSTKDTNLTPLRLLTNQARCLITIKKRISGDIRCRNLLKLIQRLNTLCNLKLLFYIRLLYNGFKIDTHIR